MQEAQGRGDRTHSHRRAAAAAGRLWPPRTSGRVASGSPRLRPPAGRGRPAQPPWRHTRRHPGRGRPYEGCLRPARLLGRRPPLLECSHHERRRGRRNGDGPPRRQAHREKRPVAGRWHHGGGYPMELPPRTIPAPAPRTPPPKPRRSAGQLRSTSAVNAYPDSPRRSAQPPRVTHPASAGCRTAGEPPAPNTQN